MKIALLNIILLVTIFCDAAFSQRLKLTEDQRNRSSLYARECREKEGITTEQLDNLKKGHFENVDHKVKCFANCFLEKAGYMKNGEVQDARMQESLSSALDGEQLKALMTKCNSMKGSDNCDTALKLVECYYSERSTLL